MRVRVDWAPAAGAIRGRDAGDWPQDRSRWIGVAIDVLRATSTLTVALANGAARVIPLARPEEALALREREPRTLACGERDGRIVPGFDLGNSPLEYSAARVAGRTLAFASTNGSQALLSLAGCGRILLASFLNASAVARTAGGQRRTCASCAPVSRAHSRSKTPRAPAGCARHWRSAVRASRAGRLVPRPRSRPEARPKCARCSRAARMVARCARSGRRSLPTSPTARALDSRAEVFAI